MKSELMPETKPRGSATSELAVVRHGQTGFNRGGLYQGHADSALTDAGMAQARLLVPRLGSLGSSPTIYCSDLGRARHTAVLLASPGFHHIREDEGLRDRCWGVFEGLSRAEITERYPDARTSSGESNPENRPSNCAGSVTKWSTLCTMSWRRCAKRAAARESNVGVESSVGT